MLNTFLSTTAKILHNNHLFINPSTIPSSPATQHAEKMAKIRQTGFLKLNFEIIPIKRNFRFLPKNFANHG